MKRLFRPASVVGLLASFVTSYIWLCTIGLGAGCKSPTAAFQTISATETAVSQANLAFLDSVVVGHTPTNSVPTVEKAFNDTQMALRAAAAVASGGSSAAVPAAVLAQATQFTNVIKQAQAH